MSWIRVWYESLLFIHSSLGKGSSHQCTSWCDSNYLPPKTACHGFKYANPPQKKKKKNFRGVRLPIKNLFQTPQK